MQWFVWSENENVLIYFPFIYYVKLIINQLAEKEKEAMLCKAKIPFMVDSDKGIMQEEGVSLDSTNNISSCISDPPLEDGSSDISLTLG